MAAMMFTDMQLKHVPLKELHDAASTLEIANYGTKKDISSRIVSQKGGKGILMKLIKTYMKKAKEKEDKKPMTPMATFKATEKARLIASGVKDKAKIVAEVNRLWAEKMKTSPVGKTIVKKKAAEIPKIQKKVTFINDTVVSSPTKMTDVAVKTSKLVPIGTDPSDGLYKYISKEGKAYESIFEDAVDEVEDRVTARLMSKKPKRDHINGMLAAYGVDASQMSMAHAKEELIMQMSRETDDENSDDEEDENDDEDDDDEDDDESNDDDDDEEEDDDN